MMRRPTWYTSTVANILAIALWILVILGLLFVWPGPQLADGNNPFTGKPSPLLADISNALKPIPVAGVPATEPPAAATEPPAAATESPVAPLPTDTPVTPTPEPVGATVDYNVPNNAGRLWTEKTGVLGYYYDCNVNKPCEITYPAQSTVIIALGAGTITDGTYTKTVTTDGTIGNLYSNVCELASGSCKATVTEFSAGNVRITIVFAPFEVPAETLAGAANRMGVAPNCGGSGCLVINAYGKNGQEVSFKRGDKVEATHVSGLLTAPVAPFVKINLIYGAQPQGAEPIILNKVVVGSIYYLAESDSFVNVPEGGGTVFYCGAKAEIDGKTCEAGTAIRFDGTLSDGNTPEDLNKTVKIVSSEPTMIRVYMIYAMDFNTYVGTLTSTHPDWAWK
jgi:hypothetical protein